MHIVIFMLMSLAVSMSYAKKEEHSDLFYGEYTSNFVIRWGFQKYCDYSFDPRTSPFMWPTAPNGISFDPTIVEAGDVLFVRDVPRFIKKMHPRISHPYIMVTCGEYRDSVTEKTMEILNDDKIIAWFSIHACSKEHPKFHPIPLGIFQPKRHFNERKELAEYFAELRHQPKKNLIYMNFGDTRGQKPDRAEVTELFQNAPYCYIGERLPFLSYMKKMSQFRFSLAPRGYGPDSYRVWEALLVGSIPIVKTSELDSLYADLPVLIVNNWQEINPKFLERKYKEFSAKKFNIEKLHMEYWWKKIDNGRNHYLATQHVS